MRSSRSNHAENLSKPLPTHALNRRAFVGASAKAFLAGVAITVLGCGDESVSSCGCAAGDVPGAISDNHGHRAVLTKAQIDAGGGVTLDITGSAGHAHTVELSADQVASIKSGNRVVVTAVGNTAHLHTVTFN